MSVGSRVLPRRWPATVGSPHRSAMITTASSLLAGDIAAGAAAAFRPAGQVVCGTCTGLQSRWRYKKQCRILSLSVVACTFTLHE